MITKVKMRLVSIFLCFTMFIGMIPMTVFAAQEVTVSTYNELWAAFFSGEDSYIKLTADITYDVPEGGNTPLQPYQFLMNMDGNVSKILDLNGHTLQVSNDKTVWPTNGALFNLYSNSSLTVMNGTIKLYNYNNSERTDAGVFIAHDNTYLTLTNVDILNARNGTAVKANDSATLTIESGTITAGGGFAVTATGTSWVILDKGVTLTTHDGGGLITQFGNKGYGSLHSETPNLNIISAMLSAGSEVASDTMSQFAPSADRLVFVEGKQYDSAFATEKSGDYCWDTAATGGCALIVNDNGYSFAKNVRIVSATAKQTVTAVNGTASPKQAAYDETVTITADTIPGKIFSRWNVNRGGVYLADMYSATTTFTMGAQPVEVKASFENAPITSADFTLAAPVQGGQPGVAVSQTDNITVTETWYVEIYGENSFSSQLPENHIFEGGHKYRAGVTIEVADGYKLDDYFSVTFTDPNTQQKTAASQGATEFIWVVDYTVQDNSVEIAGAEATVTGFVAGAEVSSATVSTNDTTYTVAIEGWYDCDNVFNYGSANVMQPSDTFEEGKIYTVGVTFTPVGFNTIANNVYASINGQEGSIGAWDNKSRTFFITVKVPLLIPAEYAVSYNANGGTGTMTGATVVENDTFTLAECTFAAPEDSKFKAWAIGTPNGPQKQPGEEIIITAETEIYAVWAETLFYDVAYNATQGSGTMVGDRIAVNEKYILEECEYLPPAGYHFKAWAIGAPDGPQKQPGEEIVITYTTYIYAVWEENPLCIVAYNATQGSGTMLGDMVAENDIYTLEPCGYEAPEGYRFKAWAIGTPEGEQYQPGDQIVITGETYIYAVWEEDVPPTDGTVELDKGYIVLKVGESAEITAYSNYPTGFSWFIEGDTDNVEFATDGGPDTCTVTGALPGTCYMVAFTNFGENTVSARCRIDVTAEDAGVSITAAHLPATTVTTNIYSTDYPVFDILFDLEQNVMPALLGLDEDLTDVLPIENNGVAIDSAYFTDSTLASLFELRLIDDRTMAVIPKFDVADEAAVKLIKSSYKSKITVVVDGMEIPTTETLILKITKKLPAIRVGSVELNSFYAGNTAPLTITCKDTEVLYAEVDYSKATAKVPAIPEWLSFNYDMSLSLAYGFAGNMSGRVYLKVWMDGYAAPVRTSVPVSVVKTAPKLKLSATSTTLNTYRDKAVETQITLLSNDKKVAFDTIGVTDVKIADVALMSAANAKAYAASVNYTVKNYDVQTGVITVDIATNCQAKAGKILLEAYVDGALYPVQLPFTVYVYNKAPTFRLSKTSLVLSTDEAPESCRAEISLIPTPADYKITAQNLSWTVTDGNNKPLGYAPLDIALDGNKVTVTTNSFADAGAKYKVTFALEGCTKTAALYVTVAKPGFKLSKTSLTVSPMAAAESFTTQISVIPAQKDYVLNSGNFSWKITDAKNVEFAEAPLNVTFNDNVVTVASNSKSVAGGKYKVVFTMAGVKNPVTLNVTVSNPTVRLAKTTLIFNVLSGDSTAVKVTTAPKDYILSAENLSWKITDSKNNVISPAPLDIALSDNTIVVSTNSNTQMKQSYKVVYTLKETNKSVTMTVNTLDAAKSRIAVALSAKGKLETGKLNTGVTIIPKWTNLLKPADITGNIRVYAKSTAKGSVAVDVTDKFVIAANADGTYSIRFADTNAMNMLNFKDKYTVTAENIVIGNQTVSTAKALAVTVTHTRPKVTQSTKEVKLYQNDRYSRGKVRIVLSDSTLPKIAAVQIADSSISGFYELVNLGNGWYGVEYKDNKVAPKIKSGTIKLNIFLSGNNPANNNPNAYINVKVTSVKFK